MVLIEIAAAIFIAGTCVSLLVLAVLAYFAWAWGPQRAAKAREDQRPA